MTAKPIVFRYVCSITKFQFFVIDLTYTTQFKSYFRLRLTSLSDLLNPETPSTPKFPTSLKDGVVSENSSLFTAIESSNRDSQLSTDTAKLISTSPTESDLPESSVTKSKKVLGEKSLLSLSYLSSSNLSVNSPLGRTTSSSSSSTSSSSSYYVKENFSQRLRPCSHGNCCKDDYFNNPRKNSLDVNNNVRSSCQQNLNDHQEILSFHCVPSASSSRSSNGKVPSQPPEVVPYIYSGSYRRERMNSSLVGLNCCFCEEPLEDILEGERLVPLQCSHVSHYECLSELIDINTLQSSDENEGTLPNCTICNQRAIPNNEELIHEIIREKLGSKVNPPFHQFKSSISPIKALQIFNSASTVPGSDNPIPYSSTPFLYPSSSSSSSLSSSSSSSSSPSLSPLSTIATSPILSSMAFPMLAKLQLPKEALGDVKSDLFNNMQSSLYKDSIKYGIREKSLSSIKEDENEHTISKSLEPLNEPTFLVPEPKLIVDTEVDSLTSSKDQLLTCAITVSVPRNLFTHSKYSLNSADVSLRNELIEELIATVPEWKNSNIERYGDLRLDTTFQVSRDGTTWQGLRCTLFQKMLFLFNEYKSNSLKQEKPLYKIKCCVALEKHLTSVSLSSDNSTIRLFLNTKELTCLWLKETSLYTDILSFREINKWYSAFVNPTMSFPFSKNLIQQNSNSEKKTINMLTRNPSDVIIVAPLTEGGDSHGDQKFNALKSSIIEFVNRMEFPDRLGLVFYNSKRSSSISMGLADKLWQHWESYLKQVCPSEDSEPKNNFEEALKASTVLLKSNKFRDHLTHIYLIGDANYNEINEKTLDSLLEFYVQHNIRIHTFGLSKYHKVDILARISQVTSGTYTYCVSWKDLSLCIAGRQNADKAVSHLDAQLNFSFLDGVKPISLNGQNRTINPDSLRDLDGQISSNIPRTSFLHSNFDFIQMGDLVVGENHTVLIQIKVAPGKIKKVKSASSNSLYELFKCEITYRDFKIPCRVFSVSRSAKINYYPTDSMQLENDFYESGYNSKSSTPLTATQPSIDNDILVANEGFHVILAIQSHNIRVITRRIELLIARTLETALFYSSRGKSSDASKKIEDIRSVIQGILASACKDDTDFKNPAHMNTKRLVNILDRDLSILAENIKSKVVFDGDVRNYVIQMVGILRNQRAYTARSRIESVYFI